MQLARGLVLVSIVLAASACGDQSTAPKASTDPETIQAALALDAVAAGIERAGDAAAAVPFRDAASAARAAGKLTKISVGIDGVPTTFFAVAQRVVFSSAITPCILGGGATGPAPSGSAGGGDAGLPPPLPGSCARLINGSNLIAWQAETPHRLLLVTGDEGLLRFGFLPPLAGPATSPVRFQIGTATLIDKNGGFWWATSGAGEDHLLRADGPCAGATEAIFAATAKCQHARYRWSFDIMMGPPPIVGAPSPATRPFPVGTGTPHVVLAPQEIDGTLITVTLPPPPPPPVPGELLPSLTVTASNDRVRFALEVKNTSDHDVDVKFGSGLVMDALLRDGPSGRILWRWSEGKAVTQVAGSRIIKAHESVSFSVEWVNPTIHGSFIAEGLLASYSHPLGARAKADIP